MRPESFRSIYRTALVRRDTLTDAYVARHNVRAANHSELGFGVGDRVRVIGSRQM